MCSGCRSARNPFTASKLTHRGRLRIAHIDYGHVLLIGSFILGPLARRYNTQVATTKVAMPLAAIFGISLAECLRFPNFYPGILISLMGFGFCGLGSFPIILELSVEVRSPDAQFYHKTLPRNSLQHLHQFSS